MRTPSATAANEQRVPVWDPFVRVFHWSLVVSFLGAYFATEEGDTTHEVLGYIALGLVAARIAWGFVGTGHGRFANFVPRPRQFFAYVRETLRGREARYLGHNPAGGAMIIALLLGVAASGVTGWLLTTDAFWGDELMEQLHDLVATLTLALAGLHVGGVIYTSWHHRENLVLAMITGRKRPGPTPQSAPQCQGPRETQQPAAPKSV